MHSFIAVSGRNSRVRGPSGIAGNRGLRGLVFASLLFSATAASAADMSHVMRVCQTVSIPLLATVLVVWMLLWSRDQKKKTGGRLKQLEEDLADLKQVEQSLRLQKFSLVSLLKNAPHGVVVLRRRGSVIDIVYFNPAVARITGYTMDDATSLPDLLERAFPDIGYRERLWAKWRAIERDKFPDDGFTVAVTGSDGQARRIDFRASALDEDKVMIMFSDITWKSQMEEEQHRLDGKIRQSQRLEAMGQLAGGVAHDFNNLLTSILGNAQLLQLELGTDGPHAKMLDQVISASERAGDLTKQLLAYAQKGKFQVSAVDIHETIHEVTGLLKHSIDKLVEIREDFQAERAVIMGDPSQLQSALLNLAVNARDAMPEGGVLTFATAMTTVDRGMARDHYHSIHPGEYLQVQVMDTGIGMTNEVRQRIFEPFFTTKETGKGTGLGLAAVYGCVKNHHGSVVVTSEPEQGTTFTILFPAVGAKQVTGEAARSEEIVRGKGYILLVDDENDVRSLSARALRRLGYRVETCADGYEAVTFYRDHHQEIDLIIMDMIMPNMDGKTAFREMRKIDREARVLVMSGFTEEVAAAECMHEGALDFIAKPFWIGDLSRTVATYIRKH